MRDVWREYDILHRLHRFCNPLDAERIETLGVLMELKAGTRVLDLACGHGGVLKRWRERFGIQGTGVDISPYAIARARSEPGGEALEWIESDAAGYHPVEPFDAVSCLGASWIWYDTSGTLRAMRGRVVPGGWLCFAEPYWIAEPPAEYLAAERITRATYRTLAEMPPLAAQVGLDLHHTLISPQALFDAYEFLQVESLREYAAEHPDDSLLEALLPRRESELDRYLRWGRDCLGFATWLFKRADEPNGG